MNRVSIKTHSPLLSAPIPGLLRDIAIPFSIGAFFNTMFNVVDTIYGGLISDEALAALSLSFPIYFIIIALGFGFSQGNTALMGNALGRGDKDKAREYAVQGLIFGGILSVFTSVVVLWSAPALVAFMGATSGSYRAMSLAYINPLFYGTIFFITVQMLLAILNTLGRTKPGRNFLAAGFFLNLLLDPWFIFGGVGLPPLGITGIAMATVLVQLLGCIYIGFEVSKTDLLTIESLRRYWRPNPGKIWRIIQQGLPNTVDTMGVSLGFFILTIFVGRFGQHAVAAMGSASRIEQVFLLPLLGLNIAVLSLVARNNGAGQIARVQKTFRTSIFYGVLIMSITMGLALFLARPIMRLFTADESIIQIGVDYVRIRSLGLIPNAIFFMSASAMRGLERPWPALLLNFIRFVGLPWLFIIIFVEQLGYGLTSIWITSTAGFYIVAAMGFVLARRILPREQS